MQQVTIYGNHLVLHEVLISQFEMGDEVQNPSKAMDISPVVNRLLVDDFVQKINGVAMVAIAEVEAGDAVLEDEDAVGIPVERVRVQ